MRIKQDTKQENIITKKFVDKTTDVSEWVSLLVLLQSPKFPSVFSHDQAYFALCPSVFWGERTGSNVELDLDGTFSSVTVSSLELKCG